MQFWKSWVSGIGILACGVMLSSAKPASKDRYAEVNGVRLHYVEQGSPLVLPGTWVVHEKPTLVIQYIRDFLKSPVGG